MEKITFRLRGGKIEARHNSKPVYPHKDMRINDGDSILVELIDRGRFLLATPFSAPLAWQEMQEEIDFLSVQRERVYAHLVMAYASASTELPPPAIPSGRRETKKEYSGGQGWDGLHGDTADDGGDYVTTNYLYLSPQDYEDYLVVFKSWCTQIEGICAQEFERANLFLIRQEQSIAKTIDAKIPDTYLYVYPRMLDFRADCFSWCCGSMFGPLLTPRLPSGTHPLHRDGLTVAMEENANRKTG